MRVAVLHGGRSSEHEISKVSGATATPTPTDSPTPTPTVG